MTGETSTKPQFRFKERVAGTYYWEPVNDEARALMMTEDGSTRVSWFWGHMTGLDVTVNAHDRAAELLIAPEAYRERVRALRSAHLESIAKDLPRASVSTADHVWASADPEGPWEDVTERPVTVEDWARLGFSLRPTTREALDAANAPVPVRVSISKYAYGGVLPSPILARDVVTISAGHSLRRWFGGRK